MSQKFESDALRCLVDIRRKKRQPDQCPEYENHPTYDNEERRENKTARLLIKAGCLYPKYRNHIKHILKEIL